MLSSVGSLGKLFHPSSPTQEQQPIQRQVQQPSGRPSNYFAAEEGAGPELTVNEMVNAQLGDIIDKNPNRMTLKQSFWHPDNVQKRERDAAQQKVTPKPPQAPLSQTPSAPLPASLSPRPAQPSAEQFPHPEIPAIQPPVPKAEKSSGGDAKEPLPNKGIRAFQDEMSKTFSKPLSESMWAPGNMANRPSVPPNHPFQNPNSSPGTGAQRPPQGQMPEHVAAPPYSPLNNHSQQNPPDGPQNQGAQKLAQGSNPFGSTSNPSITPFNPFTAPRPGPRARPNSQRSGLARLEATVRGGLATPRAGHGPPNLGRGGGPIQWTPPAGRGAKPPKSQPSSEKENKPKVTGTPKATDASFARQKVRTDEQKRKEEERKKEEDARMGKEKEGEES